MHDLKSRVAYLQGLTRGLDHNTDPHSAQVLSGIVEVLGELTHTLTEVQAYVEDIEDDLTQLEDEVYEFVDEESGGMNGAGEEFIEVECPRCDETVYFERELVEGDDVVEITCPTCDTVVFVSDDIMEAQTHHEPLSNRWSAISGPESRSRKITKDI